jgi:hypothetical protein
MWCIRTTNKISGCRRVSTAVSQSVSQPASSATIHLCPHEINMKDREARKIGNHTFGKYMYLFGLQFATRIFRCSEWQLGYGMNFDGV